MDIARSLYNGGSIIQADDNSLNYHSYIELGLRCPICGEEVHLKKGKYRKPHFAHFHKLNNSEECSLRSKAYTKFHGWKNILEGQEQRREIFQKYFLDIIVNTYPSFYKTIKSKVIDQALLNKTKIECIFNFNNNRTLYVSKYRIDNLDDIHQILILNHQITIEAFYYLFVKTSDGVLEELIKYFLSLEVLYNDYCIEILNLLNTIDWIKTITDLVFSDESKDYHVDKAKYIKSKINTTKNNKAKIENTLAGTPSYSNKTNKIEKSVCSIDTCNQWFYFSDNSERFIVGISGKLNRNEQEIVIESKYKKFFCTYKYTYCTGDVYLRKDSAKDSWLVLAGELTEDELIIDDSFLDRYSRKSYVKVLQEIKSRYLKSITSMQAYTELKNKISRRNHGLIILESEKHYIKKIQTIKPKKTVNRKRKNKVHLKKKAKY